MEELNENERIMNKFFKKINDNKIKSDNILYKNIENETLTIYAYLEEKIQQFPKLFDQNLTTLSDTINYLEKISLPNNCVCSENTDDIPGWKCKDCSDNENSIYCSKCFLKFKEFHKDHNFYFLPYAGGMCDCGNINNVKYFCPEHKGPYNEQKQIEEFIEKSFNKDILSKLKIFLDDLFLQFSKYFILTEQCTFFCIEIKSINIEDINEKEDINILNDNFCVVFQNFISFLYLITYKNMGMLYLISNYILHNHFLIDNLEEKDKTNHSCIKIENKKINILYKNEKNDNDIFSLNNINSLNKHRCECSFLRLLLSNWRNDIITEEGQNENFLFSLTHNQFLKYTFTVLYFHIYKDILFNDNIHVMVSRKNLITEDSIKFMEDQSNLIESGYRIFYEYIKGLINNPISRDSNGSFLPYVIRKLFGKFEQISFDCNFFTKSKIRQIISSKNSIIKIFIDVACLLHNKLEFKSIFPHPSFQEKSFSSELINCELLMLLIGGLISIIYDYNKIDNIKEIFDYFINKILNQKSEGIKQLEENEFSFHLTLYRFFGIFLNIFILKDAITNNKNIIDSIDHMKNKLFNNNEILQKVIDIIIYDYIKFFGFIAGIKYEYFNYYNGLNNYIMAYFKGSRFLSIDFTLLKYMLSMSDKKIQLNDILKKSNIENIYSLFNNFYNSNILYKNTNEINNEKDLLKSLEDNDMNIINEDNNNHIIHLAYILELIIIIMKNDSTYLWGLLIFYNGIFSLKTKLDFFNSIKKNKNIMKDLKNVLKKQIIQTFISHGNCIDLINLKDYIEDFFFQIFNEKEFNDIIEDLTIKTLDKDSQILSLKDSSLKYLDMNYYYSYFKKSKAELYITNFKKDKFKLFNSYYYNSSIFTFEFNSKVYENILLNIDNIKFLSDILEKIINPKNSESQLLSKIKNIFLPIILNYLTVFGCLNSKRFIKFKIDNENLINKLLDMLNILIQNKNLLLDSDLSENIANTIYHLNIFKKIYKNNEGDLNKLSDYDFNTEYLSGEKESLKLNINNDENLFNKVRNMKEKYKNIMKNKRNNFIEKIKEDKTMKDILQKEDKNEENLEGNKDNDNIICFVCRNKIDLHTFEEPYGKLGYIIKDYFYKNSFKSSVKRELNKIDIKDIEEKNKIYFNITNNPEKDLSTRIISCGHYFHQKCFKEGSISDMFKCPLCENLGNILIPPLTNFYKQELYLKSETINIILDNKNNFENLENNNGSDIFKEIILSFIYPNIIKNINIEEKSVNYNDIIDPLFLNYESYINYLGNIYFCEATTFHKQQQIDIIKNFIFSLRYLTKINYIDINQIINSIKNMINILKTGPNKNDNIMEKFIDMYYSKLIDKIIFSFSILLDYEEIEKLFKYIINWILPYICFWVYLKYLIAENKFYSLFNEKYKEKINNNNFKKYLNENNHSLNKYLKLFLKKLLILKLILKNDYYKNDIYNDNKYFSLENIFFELNMDKLYKVLPKDENNEINIISFLNILPEFLSSDNLCIFQDKYILNSDNIIKLLINNICELKEEKYLMKPELFSQFLLYKFELIQLDKNIFDWIEKNLFKKCEKCNGYSRHSVICLICGQKLCNVQHICDSIGEHSIKCIGITNIFIDNQDMRLSCLKPLYFRAPDHFHRIIGYKKFDYLYTNKYGVGPGREISIEYNLNKEKYKLTLQNYICLDFR